MKRVTLYTVNTSEVMVADRLQSLQYTRQDQLSPVVDSEEIVQTVETLPIYAVVNNSNTFYVAVSPEIRDIFLCLPKSKEELDDLRQIADGWEDLYRGECEVSNQFWSDIVDLHGRLGKVSTFWGRFRNLFRSPENWK